MPDAEKYRVLAVDDNDDMLELVRSALGESYDVMTLNHPVDLYELMDIFEPDLLILDLMMPGISGYQILEILRKNPNTKEIPIIVVSAKSTQSEVKYGYRLGATLYLAKPVPPERLRKNVETQFMLRPPANRHKALSMEQIFHQMEVTPSYKKGHVQVSGLAPARENQVDDIKKKMQERILQKRKDRLSNK